MNTKHTPGPWRLVANGTYVQASREHALDPKQQHDIDICHIAGKHDTFAGEMDANARLIAAAPDLLLAAEGALAWARKNLGTHPADELAAFLAPAIALARRT